MSHPRVPAITETVQSQYKAGVQDEMKKSLRRLEVRIKTYGDKKRNLEGTRQRAACVKDGQRDVAMERTPC